MATILIVVCVLFISLSVGVLAAFFKSSSGTAYLAGRPPPPLPRPRPPRPEAGMWTTTTWYAPVEAPRPAEEPGITQPRPEGEQ